MSHGFESRSRRLVERAGFVIDAVGHPLVMHARRGDGVSKLATVTEHPEEDLEDRGRNP